MVVAGAQATAGIPRSGSREYCWSLSTLPSAPTTSVALVHGAFKVGGRDRVVVLAKSIAHPVVEIDPNLHGVEGVDAIADQLRSGPQRSTTRACCG